MPICPWKKPSMAFFHLSDPKKAEVFWGRRSPPPAAADFIHSLLWRDSDKRAVKHGNQRTYSRLVRRMFLP
jgi:hypothetical protein